ncbi:MAG: ATP-binding cassette domain-containing protein [Burkholderiales bacterium]|nr:ATP-binding cassette domain-containing protein [Burkholderiales bacterium]
MNMSAPRDAGGLLQALATLFWIPQAALLAWAVQRVIGGDTAPLGYLAAGVLALGAMRAMLDALGARLAFRTARAALTDLRARLALALAMRSPLDRGRPAAGLAASAMAEQAGAVVPYWARFRPARLRAAIVPVVILTVVLTLSWAAAVVLLVAAPLIPLFMVLIGWRAQAASAAQIVEVGAMNGFLLDRLRGLATIRALDAVDATARRLRADAESLRRRTMAVLRIAFLSSAVLELFAALGVAVVAVYVGFHLLGWLDFGTWHGRLSLGQGLFILLLAPAFFEPLRELSAVWHDRAAGEAALAELETLTIPGMPLPAAAEVPILGARSAAPPAVWLDGVAFRYPGDSGPVLRGFDLAVKPGEKVALLGPSGVGKSTLVAGLASDPTARLLSDTFLIQRGTSVRAVPEPLLLDQWSRGWLGSNADVLLPIPHRYSLGRGGFHWPDEQLVGGGEVRLLVFPQRAATHYVRPLPPQQAQGRIRAGDLIVNDVRRYWAYASVLEVLDPTPLVQAREQSLAELVNRVPAFEVGLTADVPRPVMVGLINGLLQRETAGGASISASA